MQHRCRSKLLRLRRALGIEPSRSDIHTALPPPPFPPPGSGARGEKPLASGGLQAGPQLALRQALRHPSAHGGGRGLSGAQLCGAAGAGCVWRRVGARSAARLPAPPPDSYPPSPARMADRRLALLASVARELGLGRSARPPVLRPQVPQARKLPPSVLPPGGGGAGRGQCKSAGETPSSRGPIRDERAQERERESRGPRRGFMRARAFSSSVLAFPQLSDQVPRGARQRAGPAGGGARSGCALRPHTRMAERETPARNAGRRWRFRARARRPRQGRQTLDVPGGLFDRPEMRERTAQRERKKKERRKVAGEVDVECAASPMRLRPTPRLSARRLS